MTWDSGPSELDSALHASVLERHAAVEERQAAEDAKKREEHYDFLNSLGNFFYFFRKVFDTNLN